MKFIKSFIGFLIINFSALGLGILLMGNGPTSEWYTSMNQAPWTPPSWAFGATWTFIMICFSIYMAFLYQKKQISNFLMLFVIQFILNVSWNYVFFNQHSISFGLVVIFLLTLIVGLIMFKFKNDLKLKTLPILPYFLWLCVATSLNAYILLNN